MSPPDPSQPFITGWINTVACNIPLVSHELNGSDHWGTIKARWNIGRMRYAVDPGLYGTGRPDKQSPVFVTANYKMSFDRLREALKDQDAWILVLDTKGINVWCAAGKGTFGTEELVHRIQSVGLDKVVSHATIVLPQLSGPGVAAHEVKKRSGFQVVYGPVKAADLPVFIRTGLKATPEMRHKTFTLRERAVLIPVELVAALKWALIILPVIFILGGLAGPTHFWADALGHGLFTAALLFGAVIAGTVFLPVMLPWIPGRAFSMKGLLLGVIIAIIFVSFRSEKISGLSGGIEAIAWLMLAMAVTAYLAMNFTGSSTFTSLSGVKKEMKWAVPLEIALGGIGLCLWLTSLVIA